MQYGIQLYSVRDTLSKDYYGTLKAMADLGYKMVEKELERVPREKNREIARQNIADIKSSNRRDFRF